MVRATIYKDELKITGYKIKGHANYDDYGNDIVCAAVSVLAQNTLFSLREILKLGEDSIAYKIDDRTGYIEVQLLEAMDEDLCQKAQILLRSLEIGLISISEAYSKHVALKIEGV